MVEEESQVKICPKTSSEVVGVTDLGIVSTWFV